MDLWLSEMLVPLNICKPINLKNAILSDFVLFWDLNFVRLTIIIDDSRLGQIAMYDE
jgi:hypothetical protein